MYICSICKTPTPREGRCNVCGWVKTITVMEYPTGGGISPKAIIEKDGYLFVTKI